MAKRYRYAFAKQKEAEDGVVSTILAAVSVGIFIVAVIVYCIFQGAGVSGPIIGGMSFCAILLSVYGFIQGLHSFSAPNRSHTYSTAGSIANGIIMIGWLGLYLIGV